MSNELETGFSSRISRWSRGAAAEAERSRAADVPRGTIRERRVCRSLGLRLGIMDRSRVSSRMRVTGRVQRWAGSRVKGRGVWAAGIVGSGPTE